MKVVLYRQAINRLINFITNNFKYRTMLYTPLTDALDTLGKRSQEVDR